MNPEAKSLWIELLITTYRDKQCRGSAVYRPYGSDHYYYCGIGVLPIAYALAHGLDPEQYASFPLIQDIPDEVFKWAGLNSRDGMYKEDNGFTTTLVCKNDGGLSFQELASIIQEYF